MGKPVKKTFRADGSLFGATVRVSSIRGIVEEHKRRVIEETWDNVDKAAAIAGKSAESFGKAAIDAAGRVESGYMRAAFAVDAKASRGGKKIVKIGWPQWGKPTEYYDFQERGTRDNRVGGYGGSKYVSRKVKVGGAPGTGKRTSGSGGIEPMLIMPGVVAKFRSDFLAVLKGLNNG